ncbi:hypothetical protein GKZ89_09830 [Bacillus mangrovi]|uniref:YwqI/YxiC family protein n=1 Tax=Metabacillus mangrovi TaxID=1491830 RepID=A0A7X2S4Y4_9BACI|nr:DUF5344 family protein [Metabacillus mangrovi]MTH53702.1 hypothetical protein [Metabacillus mangrovi]
MAEIKVAFPAVHEAINQIETASIQLESDIPQEIGKKNQLDIIVELNEINVLLQETLAFYRSLLGKNSRATRDAVNQLNESDQKAAASIGKS